MATQYTATLDTILRDTIPQLPGAVRAVAERELRQTMREFFERSYAWRELVEGVDAPAGDAVITMNQATTGDSNADVVAVLEVRTPTNFVYQLPNRPVLANGDNLSDVPIGFYMDAPNKDAFKMYPFFQNAQPAHLDVMVVKKPTDTATVFPREIDTTWYDALIEGFLARMYMHPNKPYSAPQTGMQMRSLFRRRIGYYMAQAKQGYNNAPAWSFPRGWSPRHPDRRA